jgi:peptidyl-prolyl cis-trans isomerase C
MHYKDSENYGTRSIFWVIPVIIGLVVFLPADSSALWPFSGQTKESKQPHVAKVDDLVITTEEFFEEMRKLHTTGRVGKALEEKGKEGFEVQDYLLFLNEIIDNKLMIIEAENIGLDEEKDFIANLESYRLNLFLSRLRTEEILEKVKVEESEIEEYLNEQLRKKQEEKPLEETEKEEEGVDKEEEPKEITQEERAAAERALMQLKINKREKEYFSQLRAKAKVSVDEEVLEGISPDKPELMGKAVAYLDGEPLTVKDLFRLMRGKIPEDMEERNKALDRLILFKLLDKEAMVKGYEKDPELKQSLKSHREGLLMDQFKKKVIIPLVKVEEEEILEYYNSNKEQFRKPDMINLKGIKVGNLEIGRSIVEELKQGADFSFLAREESIDLSGEKGGVLGSLPANLFPTDALKAFRQARQGDILGPFMLENYWWVYEFHGIEKGQYLSLERVKNSIYRIVGKQKFDSVLEDYLNRLRASVPVDINEAELKRLEGK